MAGREPQPARAVLGVAAVGRRRASTTAGRRRRSATSPFKTTQRQYAWQNEFTLPLGALTRGLRAARGARWRPTPDSRSTQRNTEFAVRHLPAARSSAHALQANLRRDDSSQYGGKTTGAHRLRLSLRAVAARHRGLRHRLQGAVVQRPLLPGLLQSRTSCRKRRRTSRRASTGTAMSRAASARGARHRLPQPRVAADRVSVRRRLQLRAAQRRPRHARRRDAGARGARRQRRDARGVARPAVAGGRRHRQAAAAARAPARRADGCGIRLGPVRLGVELVASSLRYDDRGEHA